MSSYIAETALPTLPTIDPKEATDLDKPLLNSEILGAIKGLNAGKCPRPRFYKLFALLLAPLLSGTFNAIDDSHLPFKDLLSI